MSQQMRTFLRERKLFALRLCGGSQSTHQTNTLCTPIPCQRRTTRTSRRITTTPSLFRPAAARSMRCTRCPIKEGVITMSKYCLDGIKIVSLAFVFLAAFCSPESVLATSLRREVRQAQSSDHQPNPETLKKIQAGALRVERAKKQVARRIPQAVQKRIFWDTQAAFSTAAVQAQRNSSPNPSISELMQTARSQDALTHRNLTAVLRKYKKYNLTLSESAAIIQIGLSKRWHSPQH